MEDIELELIYSAEDTEYVLECLTTLGDYKKMNDSERITLSEAEMEFTYNVLKIAIPALTTIVIAFIKNYYKSKSLNEIDLNQKGGPRIRMKGYTPQESLGVFKKLEEEKSKE